MQDENKRTTTGTSNGNGSTFWKDLGKNAASSAIAGLVMAIVSRGSVWAFPKLKV